MGVPVVTLRGNRHAARVGATLLDAIGLDELVGSSMEDYRTIAIKLAADADRRAALRGTLRQRMLQSPLMDAPLLARAIEQVYRDEWTRWAVAARVR
jgi:predicted O-linked N-acetylglucosamine transferase (SPINDLY family)